MFMDNFDAVMGMDDFSMIQHKKITVYRNGDFSKEVGERGREGGWEGGRVSEGGREGGRC